MWGQKSVIGVMDCPICWQHQGFEIGPKIISENECCFAVACAICHQDRVCQHDIPVSFSSLMLLQISGHWCSMYEFSLHEFLSLKNVWHIKLDLSDLHVCVALTCLFLKHFFTPCMCCRSGPIMRRNQWRRSCIFQRRRSAWQTTNQSMSLKSPTPCTSTPRM